MAKKKKTQEQREKMAADRLARMEKIEAAFNLAIMDGLVIPSRNAFEEFARNFRASEDNGQFEMNL